MVFNLSTDDLHHDLFRNAGWKFFLLFICTGGLGSIALWFLFPDTNGIPLEEVAAVFGVSSRSDVWGTRILICLGP